MFNTRFLIRAAGTTAFMVLATAAVNLYVDPAKLFDWGHQYERGMAKILGQGKYVVGMSNYDERILQKMRTEEAPLTKPEWIVMGSSRSMQISSDMLGKPVLNLSVSGASIEDHVAISQMVSGWPGKKFIVGADPWIFNANSDQDRWLSVCDDYRNGLGFIGQPNLSSGLRCSRNVRWRQLMNFEYSKTSALGLLNRVRQGRFDYSEKTETSPDPLRDTIRSDGSRMYNLKFASRTPEETSAYVKKRSQPPLYALNKFEEIDERYWTMFWALMAHLKEKGKENVVIYLPAYHPEMYPQLIRHVPAMQHLEERIRAKADSLGIEVRGSYDPVAANCRQSEFYDDIHPREPCIERQLLSAKALTRSK